MTLAILIFWTLSFIFFIPLMIQPLSLGLMILISTFFLCLISSLYISSWYSYILFLIYIGGLLVMFAYVASLSPNTLFIEWNGALLYFMATSILTYLYINIKLPITSKATSSMHTTFLIRQTEGINLVNQDLSSILIALAMILLLNLVIIVKICFFYKSSLRPFKI
uniref:NADH-ubiquinone oxidoreductase chain 6 n=1 Tax=Cyclophorus martensianus TaxID=494924 RepID=A0A4V1FUM1_9CAEN|nr:NADH dehydrogenase subunit 6 [Cyclophorus martensianus]